MSSLVRLLCHYLRCGPIEVRQCPSTLGYIRPTVEIIEPSIAAQCSAVYTSCLEEKCETRTNMEIICDNISVYLALFVCIIDVQSRSLQKILDLCSLLFGRGIATNSVYQYRWRIAHPVIFVNHRFFLEKRSSIGCTHLCGLLRSPSPWNPNSPRTGRGATKAAWEEVGPNLRLYLRSARTFPSGMFCDWRFASCYVTKK